MLFKKKLGGLVFPHNGPFFLDRLHGLSAGALLFRFGEIVNDGNEWQAVFRFFPGPPLPAMGGNGCITRIMRLCPLCGLQK